MTTPRLISCFCVALTVFTGTAYPVEEPNPVGQEELQASQVPATLDRIRLARAEGKSEVVTAECRRLLRYREAELKVFRGRLAKGMLCGGRDLPEAAGEVAVVRAWLAEAENKRKDLATELPKVISYHEWRIEWYRTAREKGVIPAEELKELKRSEEELKWAKKLLTELRSTS